MEREADKKEKEQPSAKSNQNNASSERFDAQAQNDITRNLEAELKTIKGSHKADLEKLKKELNVQSEKNVELKR